MAEFFNMGGYAEFVWSSYGLTAVVMLLLWYIPRKQHENALRQLKRRRKLEKQ